MSLFLRLARKHKGSSAPQLDTQVKQTPVLSRHNSDKVISRRTTQQLQRKISVNNLTEKNDPTPIYICDSIEYNQQIEHPHISQQMKYVDPIIYLLRSPFNVLYLAIKNKCAGADIFTRISNDFTSNRFLYTDNFWKITYVSYNTFQQLYHTSLMNVTGSDGIIEPSHVVSLSDCHIILTGRYEGTIIPII